MTVPSFIRHVIHLFAHAFESYDKHEGIPAEKES